MSAKGKIMGFSQLRQGETILRLRDGNYLKVTIVVNKVVRDDTQKTPDGNSVYGINTTTVLSVWKPSEIAELESDEQRKEKEG